ncbi:hypothetical protein V8E53_009816 [Lactarius tabidus]
MADMKYCSGAVTAMCCSGDKVYPSLVARKVKPIYQGKDWNQCLSERNQLCFSTNEGKEFSGGRGDAEACAEARSVIKFDNVQVVLRCRRLDNCWSRIEGKHPQISFRVKVQLDYPPTSIVDPLCHELLPDWATPDAVPGPPTCFWKTQGLGRPLPKHERHTDVGSPNAHAMITRHPTNANKGAKRFQDMKDDWLLCTADRKIYANTTRDDKPGLAANRGVEVLPNEQDLLNRGTTSLSKDQTRLCASNPTASAAVLNLLNIRAKAEDDTWTAVE